MTALANGYCGVHWERTDAVFLQLCDPYKLFTLIKTSSFICEKEVNTRDYLIEVEWDNAWNTLDTVPDT